MTKRVLKNPIKFQVQLNEEQKEAKALVLNNKITVIKGMAGSGKSLLSAQIALDMLFSGKIEKIIITRPTVTSGSDIGALPGSIDEKLAPYTASIYDAMFRLYNKEKIEQCVAEGTIEVIPLAFMRGRNLSECVCVVDEAQNLTEQQMELMLGRLCKGSKLILVGDISQCDLKEKKMSGFEFICKNFNHITGFKVITLKTNHRDEIVEEILKVYEQFK